jgi:hypothetical protein
LVEYFLHTEKVVGSSPTAATKVPEVQKDESPATNGKAASSILAGNTIFIYQKLFPKFKMDERQNPSLEAVGSNPTGNTNLD